MEKIKVNSGLVKHDIYSENHKGGDIVFALVSSPANGRKQIMSFEQCKAYLHDAAMDHVVGTSHYLGKEKAALIDMDKLRLLIGTDDIASKELKEFKERLFNAKRIINLLEKEAGWDLSKIASVDHDCYSKGVWLLTGPKEWMSTPHMLSLVTLVIRVICRRGCIEPETENSVTKMFDKWARKSDGNYSDSEYLSSCWNKIFLVMRNYKTLFKGLTLEQTYDDTRCGTHSNGIAYLCNCSCGSDTINKRMRALLKEHKMAEINEGGAQYED